MARFAVIGTGRIGQTIARRLAEPIQPGAARDEVIAVDNAGAFEGLQGVPAITCVRANGLDPAELESACGRGGSGEAGEAGALDAVVTAVPGHIGMNAVKAALPLGAPVVDISFMPEAPWGLDEHAREAGVPLAVDFGFAPGISNLCAGHGVATLSQPERVRILVGGLPAVRRLPFEYISVFSPADVIEEYTRPVRMLTGGEIVETQALRDVEHHEFPGIGTLESFLTDGLRTLIETLGVPTLQEKTLRYPGHADRMRLLRDLGLFDETPLPVPTAEGVLQVPPRSLTLQLLKRAWQPQPGDTEFSLLLVEVQGRDATDAPVQQTYFLLDRTADGVTSMARTTALPAVILARRLAAGDTTLAPGLHVPERLGSDPTFFQPFTAALAEAGIHLHHGIEPLPR